jgi:hypothetical protein
MRSRADSIGNLPQLQTYACMVRLRLLHTCQIQSSVLQFNFGLNTYQKAMTSLLMAQCQSANLL